jgi:type II pantothenate kinase
MIIGIDVGSTTTKAITIENNKLSMRIKSRATDPVTAATGAFGKMILENEIKFSDIEKIMITGVGSVKIKRDIFGIPTKRIDEIQAIGMGGMFLSGMENIIITNIGTGTVIIEADHDKIKHFGGSGVGGGTIYGLAKMLLSTSDFTSIMEKAEIGNLSKVDLLLEDITDSGMSFLSKETTASNFGKMSDAADSNDTALGIINLVYQVIGMLSVFAARAKNTDRVIITGNGSKNLIGQRILSGITTMYSTKFIYPEDAEFATAIGAALSV